VNESFCFVIPSYPDEQMRPELARYQDSLRRLNAISAKGDLGSAHVAGAFRRELKQTLQAVRSVLATEMDPELRATYGLLLKSLKRMHWSMLVVERRAVELSTRHN
jgi:hypothetical protein